jgi:hypothetical protein
MVHLNEKKKNNGYLRGKLKNQKMLFFKKTPLALDISPNESSNFSDKSQGYCVESTNVAYTSTVWGQ